MFLDAIAGIFSSDLAIDLGTANTLVYVARQGPDLLGAERRRRRRRARAGAASASSRSATRPRRCSAARPAGIRAMRPIKDGVIADFEITEAMLRYFIQRSAQPPHAWCARAS